jgi:nucleoside-diphosphate-sugar epimerase
MKKCLVTGATGFLGANLVHNVPGAGYALSVSSGWAL